MQQAVADVASQARMLPGDRRHDDEDHAAAKGKTTAVRARLRRGDDCPAEVDTPSGQLTVSGSEAQWCKQQEAAASW